MQICLSDLLNVLCSVFLVGQNCSCSFFLCSVFIEINTVLHTSIVDILKTKFSDGQSQFLRVFNFAILCEIREN